MRRFAFSWKSRVIGPLGLWTVLCGCAPAWAGSEMAQGPPGPGRALSSSAAIDFRITIVPSLSVDSRELPASWPQASGQTLAIRPRWAPRRGVVPQLLAVDARGDPPEGLRWTRSEP